MWKNKAKTNLILLLKAGLPFTLLGMLIVFAGIYILKQVFAQNQYLTGMLFAWLAIFWVIYQPLFKNRIVKIKTQMKNT